MLVTGCSLQNRSAHQRFSPVHFSLNNATPQITVYGPLGDLLPSFDATPALDRFLYGPNTMGKTVLRNPQGMARLQNQLLVCDQGQPDVVAINLDTGKSNSWADVEHPPRCPVDVTVDQADRVYVADTTLRSILVYHANGRFIEKLSPDSDPSRRFRPCALFAHNQIVYVGNIGDRQIDLWDSAKRKWLSPLVPPAQMRGLIAPTGICATPEGILLIVDALQGMVFRVDHNRQWLRPMGKPGRGPGEFVRPKQICCTSSGMVLVSDAGRQSVMVFSSTGEYLMEIHERADRWNGWTLPMGLTALEPADLPLLELPDQNGIPTKVDEFVIVSDSLGGISLTLVGIKTDSTKGNAVAK
jgi:sugar lactone lactonase YvrE